MRMLVKIFRLLDFQIKFEIWAQKPDDLAKSKEDLVNTVVLSLSSGERFQGLLAVMFKIAIEVLEESFA